MEDDYIRSKEYLDRVYKALEIEESVEKIIEDNVKFSIIKTDTRFSLDKDGNLICQMKLTEEEMNKLCQLGFHTMSTVSTQFLTE